MFLVRFIVCCVFLTMPTAGLSINRSKPVVVTGATGYVAGVLIKELLNEGLTVHATVRDPSKKANFKYLQDIADSSKGNIKFFAGNLLEEGSFAEAMKGCGTVFHTASPFVSAPQDPIKDLIDPAVQGTEHVLSQANKTPSVTRVVLTSSAVAIYCHANEADKLPGGAFTEKDWNRISTTTYAPYYTSKTLAEMAAWVVAGSQTQWTLVTINPTYILGPGVKYHPSSESNEMMISFGDGTYKTGAPEFAFGVVDVRDVAHAHIAAAFTPSASGRYIICGHNTHLLEVGQTLANLFPSYPLPTNKIPKLLFWIVAPFVSSFDRRFVWNNVGFKASFDNFKSRKELGMTYRPLDETLADMFNELVANGAIKKMK